MCFHNLVHKQFNNKDIIKFIYQLSRMNKMYKFAYICLVSIKILILVF